MKPAGRSGTGDKAAMRAVEQDEARKLALPMQRQRNAEAGEAKVEETAAEAERERRAGKSKRRAGCFLLLVERSEIAARSV